jgi:hypothetical protein
MTTNVSNGNTGVSLTLDAGERMQLLRALLWSVLEWTESARRHKDETIDIHFAECDRLEAVIVDVVRDAGVVAVPMTTASVACLRAVADTCAESETPAVAELAIVVHDFARRTHILMNSISTA